MFLPKKNTLQIVILRFEEIKVLYFWKFPGWKVMAPKKPFYKVRRTVRAEKLGAEKIRAEKIGAKKIRAEKIGAETLAPNRARRTVRAEPTPTRFS